MWFYVGKTMSFEPSPSHQRFDRWDEPFPNGWFMALFYPHDIDSSEIYTKYTRSSSLMFLINDILYIPIGSMYGIFTNIYPINDPVL